MNILRAAIAAALTTFGLGCLTGCSDSIEPGDCLSFDGSGNPDVVECSSDEVDYIVDCDLAILDDETTLTIKDGVNKTKDLCVTVVPYTPVDEERVYGPDGHHINP